MWDSVWDRVKPKRKAISKDLRSQVWIKYMGDKVEGKCYCCGMTTISVHDYQVGHNKAVAKGGKDHISNLRPICGLCNRGMKTKTIEWYKKTHFAKLPTTNKKKATKKTKRTTKKKVTKKKTAKKPIKKKTTKRKKTIKKPSKRKTTKKTTKTKKKTAKRKTAKKTTKKRTTKTKKKTTKKKPTKKTATRKKKRIRR